MTLCAKLLTVYNEMFLIKSFLVKKNVQQATEQNIVLSDTNQPKINNQWISWKWFTQTIYNNLFIQIFSRRVLFFHFWGPLIHNKLIFYFSIIGSF